MLYIEKLKHTYGKTVISYPDWNVDRGDHAIIVGNSGCGKTTLLHLIAGLMTPTSGELFIEGKNLAKLSRSGLDRFRGENIGIVFQRPHLVRSLTVVENLILAQQLGRRKKNQAKINQILGTLEIEALKKRKVYQLSQGQAQRVSIGRAVVNEPKLLLADEPTASLDDQNCERVIKLLRSQAEVSEATLIVATHDQRVKNEFVNSLSL
ncbi:MAG: ATP-binding cassette domain-containing protein [Bacteroidota bacterium]